MANKVASGYITDPTNVNDHKRTTTGRDILKLGNVPCMTLLTVEISGVAEVVIEYSEDESVFIPVATLTETSGVQFAIPASVIAINVTSITPGYVRVVYRTVVLDNIPAQTLIVFGTAVVTSPLVSSTDHGNLTGLSDDDHTIYTLKSTLNNNGDIYIRSGGNVTRLPIGTAGQVLTVVAGLPAWV